MFRTRLVTTLALILLVSCIGCEAVKDTAETPNKIRSAAKQTRKSLKGLQQRGLVDFEVQQSLKAIVMTYTAYCRQHNAAPQKWNDLRSMARSVRVDPVTLSSAQRAGYNVHWGIDIGAYPDDDPIIMADAPNPVTRGVAVLWSNGEMQAMTQQEMQTILGEQLPSPK